MVRTRLNIGCRYSTPVRERPLHPTRSQFKPQPSQTQAPVTPATEPGRRAGGGLTTSGGKARDLNPVPGHPTAAPPRATLWPCAAFSALALLPVRTPYTGRVHSKEP